MALGMRGVLPPWSLVSTKHSSPRCSQSFSAVPALKTQPAEEEELALFRHYREKRYNGNKPVNRRSSSQVEPRFHVETVRQTEVAVRVTTCPSIERISSSVSVRPLKPIIHTSKTEERIEDGTLREAQSHSPSPAFMQDFPRRKFPQWDSRKFSTGAEAQILVNSAEAQVLVNDADQVNEVEVNGNGTSETLAAAPTVKKGLKKIKKVRAPEPIEKESFPTNEGIFVVDNEETARNVLELLMGKYRDEVHACDTEVADIDIKKESSVGHGNMICFSIYCGPMADFGEGKCQLWVDVLQGGKRVLDMFKAYFEDESIKKVWHNYSFDAHILGNHGIKPAGFYADTMHLARLWDSARGAYSLEALSSDPNVTDDVPKGHFGNGKTSMKELFARTNIKKDGTEGKLKVIPPIEELQTTVDTRNKWIHYSAYDAVCTWHLWSSLKKKLKNAAWYMDMIKRGSMYDFYELYWREFGELLVQMEAEGMLVDRGHLAEVEKIALSQKQLSVSRFQKWASNYCPDALYMNVCSDAQIRQLLFGGVPNRKDPTELYPKERSFKVPNTESFIEPGAKAPKKYRTITLRGIGVKIPVDVYTPSGWPAVSGPVLKALAGNVAVDYEEEDEDEAEFPIESGRMLTSEGVVGSDGEEKEEDLSVYGKAYAAFNGGEPGKKACMAFAALCELTSIDTLISNFIQPLQNGQILGADGRVHCSLNINTETGRLSARRPNLQNQPALEKDRYKIRHAFVAVPGKSLIVADYGQLELRLLAHLSGCRSMLEAFKAGGDFHSRTALNMYPHVRHAVEEGKVLLEWDPKPGETKPPVPLLKDLFGSERRKAKMLNFSIAYGKTAKGLAKDWKVSATEAQNTLDLWYNDRMEVKDWQQQTIDMARVTRRVHTLLGRSRHLPDITSPNTYLRSHLERAAINTPVQGSAADVAMCAMMEINRNARLRELGWKLIMQVHDEVILEGPSESCDEAKELVVKCMSFPFNGENFLQVALDVDAKYARSWYEAK